MSRKQLEVEPLSEARWARIEQSLMQRLDQMPSVDTAAESPRGNGRARSASIAGACAVAAIAAAVVLRAAWPSAQVATSRVVTEASASHVTLAETSIDLSPESGIVVREEDHATVLVLERGEVALRVAPRTKDRPFLVEAGDVHVRVVGTEFTVKRVGVGATVAVRRGVVEVRARGELARLTAGGSWPDDAADRGADPSKKMIPAAIAPASIAPASIAPAAPVVSPSIGTSPSRAIPAPPSSRPTTASASRDAASRDSSPPSAPLAPVTQAAAAAQPPVAQPAMQPASAQAQYEAAEQVERSDPRRALQSYLALARGSDAWAQNALYAAGRLQADRGARADAARLLEEYLRRFPRGSNAADARALRESLH